MKHDEIDTSRVVTEGQFAQRIVLFPWNADWVPSVNAGIEQRILDQQGDESLWSTSIDHYEAGTIGEEYGAGGEEILVLGGILSYDHGFYPPGTYLRSPKRTAHRRFTRDGCAVFVKRYLFHPDDQQSVTIDTGTSAWYPGQEHGLSVMPLHCHNGISTALVRWAPRTRCAPHIHIGSEEILVINGVYQDELGSYPAGTWIRHPDGSSHCPFTGDEGALLYLKSGR